ncbi:DNA/RNA polymerase [Cyathus striatus]|nr:DNA/RNA polymerase [Cyathus striatus]
MDACLHNLYDVARAKKIFDNLLQRPANPLIEVRTYNAFLEAYLSMVEKTVNLDEKEYWLSNAWKLYELMEHGNKVIPNASTYATMLRAYHLYAFNTFLEIENPLSYSQLLRELVAHDIPVSKVITDRVFDSVDEVQAIIKELSRAAVKLNYTHVLRELGEADALGREETDILKDVPEAMPVLRPKKLAPGEDPTDVDAEKKEIPFNLDLLRRHMTEATLARRVLVDDVSARQKLLEESVFEVAVERMKRQAEVAEKYGLVNSAMRRADLQRWMWVWHVALTARLEQAIKEINQTESNLGGRSKMRPLLGPYLSLVKAERLSLMTILEVMRLQGTGGISDGMKTTRALVAVGKAVEIEYKAQMCRQNKIQIPISVMKSDRVQFFSNLGYNSLQQRRVVAAKHMEDGEAWSASWTPAIRSRVGGILVESLMDVAKVTRTVTDPKTKELITEEQPAFYHSYEYQRGQKLGVVRLNPVVADRLAKDNLKDAIHPRHLPMLVKPKPWLSYDQGGYLYSKSYVMRFKDSIEQQTYVKQACEQGNLELVFAALDVLGSTPWRINREVFDVVLQVWNSGERMGKMPPATYDEPEPSAPENEVDMKSKVIYLQRQRSYMQSKANNHSERCSVNYKIEIARAFLGDKLYLPHNVDFRGRAYPIPPHLSHIGDDLSRGLLKFADAKPLGERGLRWLKIHLANLYGYDKATFDERVDWVMERLDDIYDSASNPLEGRRWWTKAGDPWQCLACCFELHAALESPDPLKFMSSLPVHQDGTCNGLQHYAALGGDARGAQQVNLAASDRPSDVYSHVGRMVEQLIENDVKKGDKYALMLEGKITRKVVKQTVMTTVYGVTFVGAREQIEKQLKDRKDIPEEECWPAASYLARLVLTCIGDLFSGAKGIQTWLNLCARIISKAIPQERIAEAMALPGSSILRLKPPKGSGRNSAKSLNQSRLKKEQMTSVIWTTPLGLPIVQPYRKTVRKQVMTSLQTVYIADPNTPAEVNSTKQASAFPPNFVHSLDATHMMLTALECRTQGLNFASVHDSYWTHACDIDKMSEIIRETFIALHSSDVLQKLNDEFIERYKDYKQLRDAGARLVCTPEQASSLQSISPILEISETAKPTINETETSPEEVSQIKELLADLSDEKPSKDNNEGYEYEEDWEGEEDEYISGSAKARKVADDKALLELMGKFVNLTDILPPLPQKGSFKVEDIKKSQYFFS